MQLIDEARALADHGLQARRDLAQRAQLGRRRRDTGGPFAEGVACGGARFEGIGLLGAEERGAIVLVALRIAAGDGHGERGLRGRRAGAGRAGARRSESVQEVQQIVGVLSGGIDTDDEVDGAMPLGDVFESLAKLGVAGGRLCELQFSGRGLQVVAQEGGVVAVARDVDADADAARRLQVGSGLW